MIYFKNNTRYRTTTLRALCNRLIKELPKFPDHKFTHWTIQVDYAKDWGFRSWNGAEGVAITLPDAPLVPTYAVITKLYPILFAHAHTNWPLGVPSQEFFDPILRKVGYNLINWPPKPKVEPSISQTKAYKQRRKLQTFQRRLKQWRKKRKLANTYVLKYEKRIKKLEAAIAKDGINEEN